MRLLEVGPYPHPVPLLLFPVKDQPPSLEGEVKNGTHFALPFPLNFEIGFKVLGPFPRIFPHWFLLAFFLSCFIVDVEGEGQPASICSFIDARETETVQIGHKTLSVIA